MARNLPAGSLDALRWLRDQGRAAEVGQDFATGEWSLTGGDETLHVTEDDMADLIAHGLVTDPPVGATLTGLRVLQEVDNG